MSEKIHIDTRVTVETPEGVDFRFAIAGPGKRAISLLVDLVIIVGFTALSFLLMCGFGIGTGTQALGIGAWLVVWFAATWLYGACFEAFWNGQTPGKRMQNLRVIRCNGTPVDWFSAFGRNLLRFADSFVFIGFANTPLRLELFTVGVLTMACTPRLQRLGDLFFDTMVIDESRELIGRAAGVTHGVDRIPRAECSGRYQIPERTLAVIERLFEGDRVISEGRREEIGRTLSAALRTRLGYEEPGPDPLNPHTFFRNAPMKHTLFLRRVLKTFVDDPDGRLEEEEKQQTAYLSQTAKRRAQSPIRPNPFLAANDGPSAGRQAEGFIVTKGSIPDEWLPDGNRSNGGDR